MKVIDNLRSLSNEQLIQLSNELQQTTISENAIVRQVIKDTEMDTITPFFAFAGVGQLLAFVLSERLKSTIDDLALYDKHGYELKELREIDEMQK